MKDSEDLLKVYTGNEASAILLKEKLKETGVTAMIKDDSINAFWGAAPVMTDLYIRKSDISKSIEIINEFIKSNTEK